MSRNSDFDEQQQEIYYAEMQKMKKLFKAAFILSAIPSALIIILGLIAFADAVMTAGLLAPPMIFIILWLLCAASFVCFSFSNMMERRGTAASIAAIVLQIIFSLASNTIIPILPLLAGLSMQIFCLTKYNEIQHLKEQPGYPDFNTVFTRTVYNNRIVSDSEIKQTMSGGADVQMDEISTAADNKGNN